MTWMYNDAALETEPDGFVGFVYLITELSTGKKYVGKKLFWKPVYRKVKGKRKKSLAPSDWKEYHGSSKNLQEAIEENGKENYKREILRLCKTKGEMSYFEAKEQFDRDALIRDDYYNGIISCRINQNHVRHLHENI